MLRKHCADENDLVELIDQYAFPGSLPEDPARIRENQTRESWIPKWTNLKHVYDALSIYLIEECGQQLPVFRNIATGHRGNPDLKAIAQHGSLSDAVLLLKLCVVAATSCADSIRFLAPMQDLPETVQRVLMETIQEAQDCGDEEDDTDYQQADRAAALEADELDEGNYTDYDYDERWSQHGKNEDSATKSGTGTSAADLAFEERLAKVIADSQRISREKHDLQRQIDELHAQYGSLQERYDRSQDDLSEANDRLTAVLSGRAGANEKSSEAQKDSLIASLEARVAESEAENESLRKGNEVLKIKAERVQKLQDDYDEIKIERDALARKANAAEKYRQKLEASQDLEKENASLKQKVSELQGLVKASDSRTATSSDLAREVDEYRRLLPSIEQERHEVNEMKKRIEFDYHLLQARYTESEEEIRRKRAEVEELEARLREYEGGDAPVRKQDVEEDEDTEGRDLETEEADFEAAQARLNEALLRSEVAQTADAKANGDVDTVALIEDLDLGGDAISEDELRAIMSAMRAQMAAGLGSERESGLKTQKKMVVMLEKARTRNVTLIQHIRELAEQIRELQQRPAITEEAETKEPKSESEMEQQLEEQEVKIENLMREIRLISSAWYEQNQRLATLGSGSGGGAVALMRLKGGHGMEEPKSFLGKQRRMLDKVSMGVGQGIKAGTRG